MKLTELMRKDPVTALGEDALYTAAKIFKEKKIRHLPVLDGKDILIGIITDRDLKRASASEDNLLEVHELLYLLHKIKLSDVMTRNPFTVDTAASLGTVAKMLVDNKIGCLPVMENKKLVGIVTDMDILSCVADGRLG